LSFKSIEGKPVRVTPRGWVSIERSPSQPPLRLRTSDNAAKDIRRFNKVPTLHLTGDAVQIQLDGIVLYKRSVERLLMSKGRADWFVQLLSEHQSLGAPAPSFSPFVGDKSWGTSELRNRLLRGSDFHLKDKVATIILVVISVREAIGDTVFIQAELAAEGAVHKNCCGRQHISGDPGERLALRIRYRTLDGEEERYHYMGGKRTLRS
jgi:hypothetical protein